MTHQRSRAAFCQTSELIFFDLSTSDRLKEGTLVFMGLEICTTKCFYSMHYDKYAVKNSVHLQVLVLNLCLGASNFSFLVHSCKKYDGTIDFALHY